MKSNVEKVLDRDQHLSELDNRAGEEICNIFLIALLRNYI